ncbi:MAG: phytanoyl-CoA dioxygenase family protein [Ferruginibacter sp.]
MPVNIKAEVASNGFATFENVFSETEIAEMLHVISLANTSNPTFRKGEDLFAIRQFLKEIPVIKQIVFNDNLKSLISNHFGKDYFVVKSIYFDKPESSNWFVSYHQDLTISVDKKFDIEGFGPWTTKQNQFSVQPPLHILEDNFTVRIHLDDTNNENGALKIIPKSHLNGIYKHDKIELADKVQTVCSVKKGAVMIMKPLLFHSSGKTTNNQKRRVIHIEFSRSSLPGNLNWSEYTACLCDSTEK